MKESDAVAKAFRMGVIAERERCVALVRMWLSEGDHSNFMEHVEDDIANGITVEHYEDEREDL